MSLRDKLTKEEFEKIESLENPSFTDIIVLAFEFEVDPKLIADYLIDKEFEKLKNKKV